MGRLLLVSNRLPVSIERTDGHPPVLRRSSGGLIAGLGPVHDSGQGEWIGSLGGDVPQDIADTLAAQRLVAVPLDAHDARRHYEGYSNNVLWPLFHYLVNHVAFDAEDFEAYKRVNERFADVVASRVRPGDRIWVHDYHLMLLPTLLRARLPEVPIAFFLHIPFPSSELFRMLPRREEILRGIEGANLIGVHAYNFARHLVSSFRRIIGVEFNDDGTRESGHPSRIGVFPLGVDVKMLQGLARAEGRADRVSELRGQFPGRRIVLGVDRLDYTKGIPLKLRAFRRFLEMRPDWQGKVVLLQLAVPSRQGLPAYKVLREEVEGLVGATNGALERDGVAPIHYLHRSVSADELSAMYLAADVMLVTPVRDGMNLVIKEYVASRLDDSGVAVLSEFAGAAPSFGEAILHNPWDIEGTAEAIARALDMPAPEAAERMRALRNRVAMADVHAWVRRFLNAFDAATADFFEHLAGMHEGREGSREWVRGCIMRCVEARRALFALDYDGTLVDLAPTPGEARPPPRLLEMLGNLAAAHDTQIVIISGRQHEDLGKFFEGVPVHLIAEHGLSYRPSGSRRWEHLFPDLDLSWRDAVRRILDDFVQRSEGSFVEKKSASLAWHYRNVEPGFGTWQARELMNHLNEAFARSPLEVMRGHKVIEVRPLGIHKGRGLKTVMARMGDFDFIFAAGDDRTDEDLFAMLPASAYAVKIGRAASLASHRLAAPTQLINVLKLMAKARTRSA